MPQLSEILPLFEPVDASIHDERFLNKYFLHEDIAILQRDESVLITGEKGSGKTAFCKYLEMSPYYSICRAVALDSLRHAQIVHYVSDLARLSGVDTMTLCSAFWRCVMMISAMQEAFTSNTNNLSIGETRLVNFLRETGHLERSPVDIFVKLVTSLWSIYSKLTAPGVNPADVISGILPPDRSGTQIQEEHLTFLHNYPFSESRYAEAEKSFAEYLSQKDLKILVYFDGFDRLRSDKGQSSASIDMIFSSLVDACYSLQKDRSFKGRLIIKALIPHDRWITLQFRDFDKLPGFHHSIHWKYLNLKEFVRRRLCLHDALTMITSFDSAWQACFPSQVMNGRYGIKEDTFDYILRHTQCRPRQIQHHIRAICKTFYDRKPEADAIPEIIAKSCEVRVTEFIEEYRIDHPNLEIFIGKFRGLCNVSAYLDFRHTVSRILRQLDQDGDVNIEIQKLYAIGFIGVVRYLEEYQANLRRGNSYLPPRRHEGKVYKCEFYYESDSTKRHKEFHDDDLIAIHPMFHDRCECTAHSHLLVG